MGITQSVVDIAGEWFIGSVKASTVQIGAGGVLTVDNTTTPPTVTAGGTKLSTDYLYTVTLAGAVAAVNNNAAIPFTSITFVSSVTTVTKPSASQFRLGETGVYELSWQGSITGAAQIGLYLVSGSIGEVAAGNMIPRTVAGRARATCQLSNTNLIEVVTAPVVLELRNVTGSPITFTADAGGLNDVVVSMRISKTN